MVTDGDRILPAGQDVAAGSVSVIVPTFDRAGSLPRALDSIAAQTTPPGETLVVDDGSGDDTVEIVKERYPGARLLRQPRTLGVSAARNLGIRYAKGRWLAFLDSDDEWRPRKLELQLRALAASQEHRFCHTDEIWMRRGRRVNPRRRHQKPDGWVFEHCLPLCAISPSSVLLHREILDRVGLFDESLPVCEDYDLWLRVCSRYPVLLVAEPLVVKHGGHDDQLSRSRWGMDRYRIAALEKILDAGVLSTQQHEAARRVAVEKTEIYLAGVRKRGRKDELKLYEQKLERWTGA